MYKYLSGLFLLGTLLISQSSVANCGNCAAKTCSRDSSARLALDKKSEEMREDHLPERLVQLLRRVSPSCASCINGISTKAKIKWIKNGTLFSRQWSPPLERQIRQQMKAGQLEAFYLSLNDGKKCSCCDSGAFSDLPDYDEDLQINRNGPVFAFESPGSVGTDQTSNHYSRPEKSYPPVREFNEPQSPRVIHSLCQACQTKEDAYNGARFSEYGLEMELYSTEKELDISTRVLAGLHNEKRSIYVDTNLSETEFFQKVNEIDGRINQWKQSKEGQRAYILRLRRELDALSVEIPQRKEDLEKCEASPACEKKEPLVKDPHPSERVACNEEVPLQAPFRFVDLENINTYLLHSEAKYNQCNGNFDCPKMNCEKMGLVRDLNMETEKRLKETQAWSNKYLEMSRKHWKVLFDNNIEKQTQQSKTEFAQSVQSFLHNVSSSTLAVWDIHRALKSKASEPRSPTDAVNETRRQEILRKLNSADSAFENASTAIGLLNTLTSDIQFPFVEGQGVPGLRTLNKLTVSLGFCIKSVASELKDTITNVKDKKPGWKGNVLALAVKGLQCYSILQQMERADLITQINKELDAEEEALKSAHRSYSCLTARSHKIEELLESFSRVTPEMKNCVEGSCGKASYPPNLEFDPPLKGYGRALKMYEAILSELGQRIALSHNDLVFTESPAPTMAINKSTYLPSESLQTTYEVPWCIANSAWIGIVPSQEAHGPRSVKDQNNYAYQLLRGQWQGGFDFRSPANEGNYDIRLYKSGVEGEEIKSVSFETSSNLGNLVNQQNFAQEFRRPLANEYEAPTWDVKELQPGLGRVFFYKQDAALKIIPSYVYGYRVGEAKPFYTGWASYLDLPTGNYGFTMTAYTPHKTQTVNLAAGDVKSLQYVGDGRLKFINLDAFDKPIKSYVYIHRSGEEKPLYSGWHTQIDLSPGKYDLRFSHYTPHIVYKDVEVREMEQSTIKTGGYGRLSMTSLDALEKSMKSYVRIYKTGVKQQLYSGWTKEIDLPPGSYDLHFTSYTPHIVLNNITINAGLDHPIQVGGYGRLVMDSRDALNKEMKSYVRIFPSGSSNQLYSGWTKEIDLPPGYYDLSFTSYTPHIQLKQVEVYKKRSRTVWAGGYGRLQIVTDRKVYVRIYDANDNSIYSGWQKQIDLPPGGYRVEIENQDYGVRITKGQITGINL